MSGFNDVSVVASPRRERSFITREEREKERENRTTRLKKLVSNTRLNFNITVKRAIFDLIRELRSTSEWDGRKEKSGAKSDKVVSDHTYPSWDNALAGKLVRR